MIQTLRSRHRALFALTITTVLSSVAFAFDSAGPVAAATSTRLGIYDPSGSFANSDAFSIEHIYVMWNDLDRARLREALHDAQTQKRQLMVSVEPWPKAGGDTGQVLDNVVAGDNDDAIDAICGEIGKSDQAALIRWGHEMDQKGRYPWAGQAPQTYIAAYRHFVTRCRASAPQALYVWSPIGSASSADYYPGGDAVDFVGLSVFGLERWDIDQHGHPLSFADRTLEKWMPLKHFGKKLIVAECGVSGSAEYRTAWLRSFTNVNGAVPGLEFVVYFDSVETWHWPEPYGSPDWRISPADIGALVNRNG